MALVDQGPTEETLMARFLRAALAVAIVSVSFSIVAATHAPATSTAVADAVAWLKIQQQPDGGFEVVGFPGFETPDAVFALAQGAQTGSTWSTISALAAVTGTTTGGNDALDAVDTYASGSIGSGQAGKLITLVTSPLGIDPATFDPSGNGVVNLVSELGTPGPDNKWGIALASFNSILFATRGYARVATVPAATIQVVRDAQKSDGSWSYNGVSSGIDGGTDTTGLAVQALLDAGLGAGDATVARALDYLVVQQQADGAWTDGFSENPNSTAVAMLALTQAGRTGPLVAGDAYLAAQQQPDGHIEGPYDFGSPNTFGTSQAIEALQRVLQAVPASSVVQTITPATGSGGITIETSAGQLDGVTAVNPTTLPSPPAGTSFPNGLVSFSITGLERGATATVRLILPSGTTVERYFKFNGTAWSDATSLATIAGNVVTLTLTDGGAGDEDGVANGVIVDPGGPSVATAAGTPGVIANPASPAGRGGTSAAPAAADAILLVPRFTG